MRLILILPIAAFAGCAELAQVDAVDGVTGVDPTVQTTVVAPPPPTTATTVEEFDTTTEADRAAAVTQVSAAEQTLGTTIASLGPPVEPGIWLKTPLVSAVTAGRVTYEGNSVNIELRPSGGDAGSGSQISLAAMRLLEAPLTGLPELTVFAFAP